MSFCSYTFHNDSSGKEHLMMEFARAKGYSDHLSDDVTRSMHILFDKGKSVFGKSKPGYIIRKLPGKPHGIFVPHPVNFLLIRKAFELAILGRSHRDIADTLNEEGYRTPPNKDGSGGDTPIDYRRIGGILRDSFYYGLWRITTKSREVKTVDLLKLFPEEFEAVVHFNEWAKVQRQMEKDNKLSTPKGDKPLAGIIKCSAC